MEAELDCLKVDLKRFEIEFVKENTRKPSKNDLLEYPAIKLKYDKYSSLKKSLLEKNKLKSASEKNNENEKVLSPRNAVDDACPKTSINDGVWGSNLLKKNTAKPNAVENSESKENVDCAEKLTCDWRSKMRKNILTRDSLKELQSNLKKRNNDLLCDSKINSCKVEYSLENLVTASANLCSTEQDNHNDLLSTSLNSHCDSVFVNHERESDLSGPFCKGFTQRQSYRKKTVDLENFEFDDLSDLLDLSKYDSQCKISDNSSVLKQDVSSENEDTLIKPTLNETESFIEANFRDGRAATLSTANDEMPSFSYEDVCLSSLTCSKEIDVRVPIVEECPPKCPNTVVDNNPSQDDIGKNQEEDLDSMKSSKCGSGQKSAGNYVMLNLKKKAFCRGGNKGMFLRKQILHQKLAKKGYSCKSVWKGKGGTFSGRGKSGGRDKSEDKCFKCGRTGHWAKKCNGSQTQQTSDDKTEPQDVESLEEILKNIDVVTAALNGESPPEVLKEEICVSVSETFSEIDSDSNLIDNNDVKTALKMFKYTSFRPGQERAIRRILQGLPTLLVLATGSGKSLCYQLPAYLYAIKKKAITLVVSPLVSLMDDQVRGLPKQMKAARIHSGMTKEQREKTLLEVENGKIHVLLVSPEAITSWAGMSPKYSPLSKLPPISFACIDECHCLSEWSHAFRPSYLRVCKVLKDRLHIKCLIGLTATATMDTCGSVAKQLGIVDPCDGIIARIDIPDNLVLSVSKDRYKDEALADLLVGSRFSQLDSVIVYCSRRDEAARVASLLRIKMMDIPALQKKDDNANSDDEAAYSKENSKKRSRAGSKNSSKRRALILDAECYHAGMTPAERRRIQNKFMNGSLRVVVATVAFGMGIDKQDVRSVIHYNMPMSFERYVQEVGRAGRDGKPAHCHVFLDSDGKDLSELSRHCCAKTIDRYIIKKFLRKVFVTCDCAEDSPNTAPCKGHFTSINIDDVTQELDVKQEGLETLLCYLEIEGLIDVYLPAETHCTIFFYGGPSQMIKTAKRVHAVALALKMNGSSKDKTSVEFDAMKLADLMQLELPALKKMLRYLTFDTSLSSSKSEIGKSGIEVQFSKWSFCLRSRQKASDEFLDMVLDYLHKRVIVQENKEVNQLETCFETLKKFSHSNVGTCRDCIDQKQSSNLKGIITKYFREKHPVSDKERDVAFASPDKESDLRTSIRQFLTIYGNDLGHKLTGRAIARIFHGIDSLQYSAKIWGTVRRFWRSNLHVDFNLVRKTATEEILASRTGTQKL